MTAAVWSQLWTSTFSGGHQDNEEDKWFDSLLTRVRMANLGVKTVLMIPVGDMFYAMNQKMSAGKVAGTTSIWDVYSDGIHMNSLGSYIIACTFYATLYKQDPRGLAVPPAYGSIADAARDTIQQTVFDIVFNHPHSGATMADLVPVSGVSVTPATLSLGLLQSATVAASVLPANAANKRVTWLSDNTGVAIVDAAGVVTAVGNGSASVIARSNDGGLRDTCAVTVTGTLPGATTRGILAAWELQGISGQDSIRATTVMAGVDSTKPQCRLSIGSGMSLSGYVGNGIYGSSQSAMTLTEAIAGKEWFSFTIAPQAGRLISVDTVFMHGCSQDNNRTFSLFSSVRGFTQDMVLDSFSSGWSTTRTTALSGHANQPGGIEFRVTVHGFNNQYQSVGFGGDASNEIAIRGTVFAPSDAQAPTAPESLAVSQIRDTSVYLSWKSSSDNLVVWGYNVYRGTTKVNSSLVKSTGATISGMTSGNVYSLGVEAVDFVGNVSSRSTISVRANRAPTAAFTATPTSGNGPLPVQFEASGATDPDSGDYILGYVWDFGDGSALDYSNRPLHTYTAQGSYTVSLRVVDSRDMYSQPVTGTISVGPTGAIRMQVPAVSRKQVRVKAYDLSGRLVYCGTHSGLQGALTARGIAVGGVYVTREESTAPARATVSTGR